MSESKSLFGSKYHIPCSKNRLVSILNSFIITSNSFNQSEKQINDIFYKFDNYIPVFNNTVTVDIIENNSDYQLEDYVILELDDIFFEDIKDESKKSLKIITNKGEIKDYSDKIKNINVILIPNILPLAYINNIYFPSRTDMNDFKTAIQNKDPKIPFNDFENIFNKNPTSTLYSEKSESNLILWDEVKKLNSNFNRIIDLDFLYNKLLSIFYMPYEGSINLKSFFYIYIYLLIKYNKNEYSQNDIEKIIIKFKNIFESNPNKLFKKIDNQNPFNKNMIFFQFIHSSLKSLPNTSKFDKLSKFINFDKILKIVHKDKIELKLIDIINSFLLNNRSLDINEDLINYVEEKFSSNKNNSLENDDIKTQLSYLKSFFINNQPFEKILPFLHYKVIISLAYSKKYNKIKDIKTALKEMNSKLYNNKEIIINFYLYFIGLHNGFKELTIEFKKLNKMECKFYNKLLINLLAISCDSLYEFKIISNIEFNKKVEKIYKYIKKVTYKDYFDKILFQKNILTKQMEDKFIADLKNKLKQYKEKYEYFLSKKMKFSNLKNENDKINFIKELQNEKL